MGPPASPHKPEEMTLLISNQKIHFTKILASTDQTIPSPVATRTTSDQITFEMYSFFPLSKMYCIPWRELAPLYSTVVLAITS